MRCLDKLNSRKTEQGENATDSWKYVSDCNYGPRYECDILKGKFWGCLIIEMTNVCKCRLYVFVVCTTPKQTLISYFWKALHVVLSTFGELARWAVTWILQREEVLYIVTVYCSAVISMYQWRTCTVWDNRIQAHENVVILVYLN